MKNDTLPTGQARIDELKMIGIVKRFPGVLANDHIDFDVKAGEIHALLGEGKKSIAPFEYIFPIIFNHPDSASYIPKT